ncbi:endogenous retrovirus group K member 25 Pol protein-like protein [Willisornis vidua]|uniref:Endogenous retrovirus group K member 25 Pol protein-like protein n=1 Tax=Willisornis vidua TaxID=1566151 RepID=A0ABQ9DBL6_9PASS|nr:endogenous retrovirus group K member 25 Pol protein-like protein [Willisornis vidua]
MGWQGGIELPGVGPTESRTQVVGIQSPPQYHPVTIYTGTKMKDLFASSPKEGLGHQQFAFTWKGIQYTWNRLPQGWKHSLTICHGLIQIALEKDEAPEHWKCIDDIIVWGNSQRKFERNGRR